MTIIGLFGTIILLVLARPIALASTWDKSILAIMFLSPTILFSCILSVYRGYMQGIEDMETIGISQIVEQIITVVLSLVFAGILIKINEESSTYGKENNTVNNIAKSEAQTEKRIEDNHYHKLL